MSSVSKPKPMLDRGSAGSGAASGYGCGCVSTGVSYRVPQEGGGLLSPSSCGHQLGRGSLPGGRVCTSLLCLLGNL